ncbi:MAG: hypothetical protein QOH21_1869 [Acidobacteriota bacterium]|jgi:enoyl-CoA hydratase/carnithine racemase|nr:hypothetical protein [Acidobacteriota bacterium]
MSNSRWQFTKQSTTDGVRTITINRPEQRNALTPDLYRELKEGLLEGWADPGARMLVLRGCQGVFASGGDLKHFRSLLDGPTEERLWQIARSYEEPLPFRTILECPKPVISVVDGLCLAGGLVIAACSDHVIATSRSSFGVPEARVGLADPFCAVLLPRVVGDVRARHLMLTARRIDGETAEQWGLVTDLVPPEELDEAVERVVRELKQVSPDSTAAYKRATNASIPHMSTVIISDAACSENGREGLAAFAEKRTPNWT